VAVATAGPYATSATFHELNKSSAVAEIGDQLATIDMSHKVGRGCCGGLGPHWVPI